jgi:hypothetical protein
MVLGLIKSRKVQFHSIANGMKNEGDTIQTKSIVHRLEDFFREVVFDYDVLAKLLFCCLGAGKIRLCIDRTEWNFGVCQVNILMVVACVGCCHVPLYWEMLDNKSGNSNTKDRTLVFEKIINLIGVSRIGLVIGDREFIGHSWLKYLKDNHINFCIRVPKSHLIERLDGRIQKVEDLASAKILCLKDCLVDGVWVNVFIKKLENGEYLFLAGTMQEPKHLGQVYRKRWTIETLFQSFKKRGFDIESTHIKDLERLKKLVGVVSLAFAFCISLGIYKHEKVQKIEIKKNGYKAKSFCRTGIDWIQDLCKQSVEIFEKAITPFIQYLIIQEQNYKENNIKYSLSIT